VARLRILMELVVAEAKASTDVPVSTFELPEALEAETDGDALVLAYEVAKRTSHSCLMSGSE
jgi:hypothetical protein